jgi:Tol biopolymer transport system component
MPRWSSDGRWLAYARPSGGADPGKTVVAVLSPDERQEQLVALQGNATMRPSDWSRDGRTILGDCRIAPGQPMGICSIPAPGQDAVEPSLKILLHDASRNLYGPRLSPDQRWVSFVAVDVKGSTTSQLFAAPVDGGPWVPLTDGRSFADKPRWSPDGHALYFVSDRNGYLNLNGRKFDAEAGGPVGDVFPVTSFENSRRGLPPNIAQIEFAVTHHRLFLPLTDTEADIWILDHVDR